MPEVRNTNRLVRRREGEVCVVAALVDWFLEGVGVAVRVIQSVACMRTGHPEACTRCARLGAESL